MIHVYWASQDQKYVGAYLKYIRREMPWVALATTAWPDRDPYAEGFLAHIRIDAHLDPFHDWILKHVPSPALVFTDRQIRRGRTSNVLVTGLTRWPLSLVTTTFSETEKLAIPEEVIARTALHEVAHLARGHQCAVQGEVVIGDLDEGGHCSKCDAYSTPAPETTKKKLSVISYSVHFRLVAKAASMRGNIRNLLRCGPRKMSGVRILFRLAHEPGVVDLPESSAPRN
jgi:hypothetical protein